MSVFFGQKSCPITNKKYSIGHVRNENETQSFTLWDTISRSQE